MNIDTMLRRAGRRVGTAAIVALLAAATATAQATPHIGYIYPAGLQRGTVGEIVVGGSGLQGATAALFSGRGLRADVLEHTRPMTNKERNAAREQLGKLRSKQRQAQLTREEQREANELRKKLAVNPRQQLNPQLAETVVLRISVADDTALGSQDLRLRTPTHVSNPLRFEISDLREQIEPERTDRRDSPAEAVELPVILNGQILPGEVDRFRFHARQGMRLVAATRARVLIPYLADAVPGWFQAVLTLYDAEGREVAYDDDHRFSPDPLLVCDIPADGDYVLEIRDAIYRGREDFVYRIGLGELPIVTSVFPLGARADRSTEVRLQGFNLGDGAESMSFDSADLGIRQLPIDADHSLPNPLPFAVDRLPEVPETEPNDELAQATRLLPPKIVNGVISQPGDRDVFTFKGTAGQRIVAEVLARRLDSPLDSMLRITNEHGLELAHNDDHVDPGDGLTTHQADSLLSVTLPTAGIYSVQLTDTQGQGGPDYAYRLRIGPPRPDFALRVTPSAINVRAGATAVFTVHALRVDGFKGDIHLELKDPPAGFQLSGAWVPSGQDVVQLTLTAPAKATGWPVELHLEGQAKLSGKTVRRQALPAEDMMQAFIYRHLVTADQFLCSVARGNASGAALALNVDRPIRLKSGGTTEVRFTNNARRAMPADIEFVLRDAPPGIDIAGAEIVEGDIVLTLRTDAAQATSDLKGNLIVDAFLERTVPSRDASAPPRVRRSALGTLPAIPFEIVRR